MRKRLLCRPYSIVLVIPAPNGEGICDSTAREKRNHGYLVASIYYLNVRLYGVLKPRRTVAKKIPPPRSASE